MKENLWKAGIAAAGAAVVSYLGALAAPLLVLLCVMLIDYVTGLVKAYMASQLSSRMVAVGAALDYLLTGALAQAGIDLHIEMFCGMLVAIWLIVNELISILENLAEIGVPGMPVLTKLLSRLRGTLEDGAKSGKKE